MSQICVIGGANIDICGSSISPLRNYDSNPGQISISYGGVGRNIAQICALLKQNIRFVSCFSSDNYGMMMKQDCENLGMSTEGSLIVNEYPSSMYIAILDHNRDMKVAMSDMRILRKMDSTMLEPVLSSLHQDDIVVIDANLDIDCVHYILEHAPCKTAADPVSANKASRLKDSLAKLTIFKPNQFEATELNGITIKDEESAKNSLDWFLNQGVEEIIISLADRGILLGTKTEKIWFTHRMIELENATGGGDSFLGAYLSRRIAGESPVQALRFGISAAVTTIEQDAVNRRSLNTDEVLKAIETMDIKEKKL